jgi:tetratricopeptide (TPR) repeat protein
MDDVFTRYREALRLGHQQAAEGHYKDALSHYRTAAQLAGERALPHVFAGGMLVRLGRAKEALKAYDHALEMEPDDLAALTGRAAALLAIGRRGEAAQVQRRVAQLRAGEATPPEPLATETAPVGAEALLLAGWQARDRGADEAAIEAWLAESREHARDEHFEAALDACLRALSLAPGAPRIHVELARIYFKRGWRELAVERVTLLERLLALEPDDAVSAELRQLSAENPTAPQS